jgi:mRNA interferase RelE/StbE
VYKILLHKKVIKFISSRTIKEKHKIKNKFSQIEINPYPTNKQLDIKKLQGKNGFRLRIGNYRFIYDVIDDELIVYMENANSRGNIY